MLQLCKSLEDKYGSKAGYSGANLLDVLFKYWRESRSRDVKRFARRRIRELRRAKYKGLPVRYWGRDSF
ncbi:MAG TPA: hypothetical protein VLA12_13220 [Planctomycetaceae bacterium]|nr:hypothetical protein [Planctomycetaceae bacterium]